MITEKYPCGRAYAYGLAAAGEAGIERAIDLACRSGPHAEAARVSIHFRPRSFLRYRAQELGMILRRGSARRTRAASTAGAAFGRSGTPRQG